MEEATFELGLDTWVGRGECVCVCVWQKCTFVAARRKAFPQGLLYVHHCVGIWADWDIQVG